MSNSVIKNMKIAGVSVILGENKRIFAQEPEYYNNDEKQLAKLKILQQRKNKFYKILGK